MIRSDGGPVYYQVGVKRAANGVGFGPELKSDVLADAHKPSDSRYRVANAYKQLADGLVELTGKTDEAREFYRQALVIDWEGGTAGMRTSQQTMWKSKELVPYWWPVDPPGPPPF